MSNVSRKKNVMGCSHENQKNLAGNTPGCQFSGPYRPLEEAEQILKQPSDFDRLLHAWLAEITLGISPAIGQSGCFKKCLGFLSSNRS